MFSTHRPQSTKRGARDALRPVFAVLVLSILAPPLCGQAPNGTPTSSDTQSLEHEYVKTINLLKERVTLQEQRLVVQQNEIDELKASLAQLQSTPSTSPKTPSKIEQLPLPIPRSKPAEETSPKSSENTMTQPLAIRIGGTSWRPFGMVDITSFIRSRAVGSGLATNFSKIPTLNTAAGQIGESDISFQNSRLGFQVDTRVGLTQVTGLFESDFVNDASFTTQTFRGNTPLSARLYWIDVTHGGLEFLGGQAWSLMTPGRVGISALPGNVFYTTTVDPSYQIGQVWARTPQFRFVLHPSSHIAFGISVEKPDQYIGNFVRLPTGLASELSSQFDSSGTGSGTPSPRPDFVTKLAIDRPFGLLLHLEAASLVRSFQSFNTANANHSTKNGFAGSLNANLSLYPTIRLFSSNFVGQAGGRFLGGLAPDLVVRTDGTLSLVRGFSTLEGLEFSLLRSTSLYGYYGEALFKRNVSLDANGEQIGFGYQGSSADSTREAQELTVGLNQRLFGTPYYGYAYLLFQYSHVGRETWGASTSVNDPKANMFFSSFRYIIP